MTEQFVLEIEVKRKGQYGHERYWPVNDLAKLLVNLQRRRTCLLINHIEACINFGAVVVYNGPQSSILDKLGAKQKWALYTGRQIKQKKE